MMGIPDWHVQKEPHIPHNPGINGLKYLYDYSPKKAQEFLSSPDWTRAIFVRDPKHRVLSAYMDKALRENGWYVREKCCKISANNPYGKSAQKKKCKDLAPFSKNITAEVFPFEKFITQFLESCNDPHWRPQRQRLPDIAWDRINFVGHFSNLREDAQSMLERIGAWEEFGASGWPGGSIFEINSVQHKTSSGDYIDEMFTPKLESTVYWFYREDYEHPVMNFTKPPNFPRQRIR
jgi:hypothetical protein